MKVGVFGSGEVGTAIATKFRQLGHDVVYGSRHAGDHRDGIPVLSHEQAAIYGEWVVNALHGEDALETLPRLPLEGKLLLDNGNFRSALDGPLTRTLGEELQTALPQTRVVKWLNFVSSQLMGQPEALHCTHTVFIAGNEASDRADVARVLHSFGWKDVVDLGDLTACRAMEQLVPMWVRLNDRLGHVYFNLAVVRRR